MTPLNDDGTGREVAEERVGKGGDVPAVQCVNAACGWAGEPDDATVPGTSRSECPRCGDAIRETDAHRAARAVPTEPMMSVMIHLRDGAIFRAVPGTDNGVNITLGETVLSRIIIWRSDDARRLARAILAVTDPEGA